MKWLIVLPGLLISSSVAFAYGEAGRWSSGWGQGTSEYTAVVNAQNNLYIACNDTRKVSMTATVQGKEYGSYVLGRLSPSSSMAANTMRPMRPSPVSVRTISSTCGASYARPSRSQF